MPRASSRWTCAALLGLCACATTAGDPWVVGGIVFQDGDVIGRVASYRSASSVNLSWIGVRSNGERLLRGVRLILFDDANGDFVPQPEEQLTRWVTQSAAPQREFSVKASFEAQNVASEVLARLLVFTEVDYEGPGVESVSETRPLP